MLASCAAACVSCSRMVCPYQTIKYFVYSVLNKVWAFRWCGREGLWCKDWPCVDSSTKPCFIFRSSCHATCIVQLSSSPNSVATGHIEHCSITCLKKSRDTIIYVSIAIKKVMVERNCYVRCQHTLVKRAHVKQTVKQNTNHTYHTRI